MADLVLRRHNRPGSARLAPRVDSEQSPSRPAGRHRLGTPGLRPCRELCRVAERPPRIQPRALVQGSIRSARLAAVVVVLGTLAVSSWFAAAGATAFADMVHP